MVVGKNGGLSTLYHRLNSINELEANLKWSDKNIFYPIQNQ